jgi:hypothetical protein
LVVMPPLIPGAAVNSPAPDTQAVCKPNMCRVGGGAIMKLRLRPKVRARSEPDTMAESLNRMAMCAAPVASRPGEAVKRDAREAVHEVKSIPQMKPKEPYKDLRERVTSYAERSMCLPTIRAITWSGMLSMPT